MPILSSPVSKLHELSVYLISAVGFSLADIRINQVAGEAQGSEQNLSTFLEELHNGPRAAHVVKVEKEEISIQEGESAFNVK